MRATSSMSRAAKPMCKMPSGFNSCTSMDCCVAASGRAMGWYGCAPTCAIANAWWNTPPPWRAEGAGRPEPSSRETSAHRIEGEADPLLVVTDGGEAQPSEPDRGPWVSLRRVAAQSAWRAEGAGRPEPSSQPAPEGNDSGGQHRRPACRRRRRPIASRAGAEGAGADPRRNGDDYPMTSLSDGLGPQKDPNSGRTRVESGPAGTHRPTTRRGSAI